MLLTMVFDRARRDVQVGGDPAVAGAGGRQAQDVDLARGQRP